MVDINNEKSFFFRGSLKRKGRFADGSDNLKNGFTLIECTAYLAGLLTLIYLISSFTQSISSTMLADLVKQRSATQIMYAMQLLARDIRAANPAPSGWLVDKNRLIMHHDNEQIGWEIIDEKLYRIRGEFSANKWIRTIHKMQLAACPMIACQLNMKNSFVRSVELTEPIQRIIAVKNGSV